MLDARKEEHPVSASIAKAMFDADGKLQGWAAMVKTAAKNEGGDGRSWHEGTSTTDGMVPVASGNGVAIPQGMITHRPSFH